jgi:hypothetical protein
VGLILLILLIAIVLGVIGFAAAIKILWILALILLVLWLIGFFARGAEGACWPRGSPAGRPRRRLGGAVSEDARLCRVSGSTRFSEHCGQR